MILYRGSIKPEIEPKQRRYAGVFFAPDFKFAAEYGPFVNKYEVPKPRILEFGSPAAAKLVYKFTGHKPSRTMNDPVELNLFWHPTSDWGELVLGAGYTATAMGWNIALFDLEGIRLLEEWRIEWKDGKLLKFRGPW